MRNQPTEWGVEKFNFNPTNLFRYFHSLIMPAFSCYLIVAEPGRNGSEDRREKHSRQKDFEHTVTVDIALQAADFHLTKFRCTLTTSATR